LTALVGPGWVIGADALSFGVLAASAWLVSARLGGNRVTVPAGRRPVACVPSSAVPDCSGWSW